MKFAEKDKMWYDPYFTMKFIDVFTFMTIIKIIILRILMLVLVL